MRRAAALFQAGRLGEAEAEARAINAREPRHFYSLHLLATIAAHRGDWEDTVALATRALEIQPDHVEAMCNRGAALRMLHRFDEALRDYARALELQPDSAIAWNSRGVALAALNRHREALESFERALALRPDYAQARYGRGVSRLMLRDFAGGWQDYEWRWSGSENATAQRDLGLARFAGEDFGRGHRVALWGEQGAGDQLLFSTLVPELEARGEDFVLEVDARLAPAFRRAHPHWKLATREDPSAFAGCDRQLPLGSLPGLLRRDAAAFARQPRQLLLPDPERAAEFRRRLAKPARRLVGISWRSFQPKMRSYYERRKSAPLEAFMALARDPSLRLVDLQYGDTSAERMAFDTSEGLAHLDDLDLYGDLDGLLALIAACDAVVSTSNVTVHLAGAIGRRTLLLYLAQNPPFHYWVPDASGRSPWHASVEIVTGPDILTWGQAVAAARGRLREGDLPREELAT